MKYVTWLTEWLDDHVQASVKERTIERYRKLAQNLIVPRLGELELDALTPMILQEFVYDLSAQGSEKTHRTFSASYVNLALNVIKTSLRDAYMLGLIDHPLALSFHRAKGEAHKVECFTINEQKKIEAYAMTCGKDKFFGFVLCLYTGLRIGELLALTWTDMDLVKGTLTVNKTCHDGHRNGVRCRVVEKPKTLMSERVIPIPKQLLPQLKALKKRSGSPFVVSDGDRTIYTRSYQKSFDSTLKRLGIPHKGFHALRHTFATRALECGMDVKTLAEILGHTNPSVTLKCYAHSMMDHKTVMMNRLGRLF